MAAFPNKSEISASYPNPSNDEARIGFGKLWDALTGLLGTTGDAADARTALGAANVNDTLGCDQTYTTVPTAAFSTWYQNTSAKPIFISVSVSMGAGDDVTLQVGTDGTSATANVAYLYRSASTAGSETVNTSLIVPPGIYYRLIATGTPAIQVWAQLA